LPLIRLPTAERSSRKRPAGNGDGNLDPNEFIELPIAVLLDRDANLFGRFDPRFDFLAQTRSRWHGRPTDLGLRAGRKYQVEFDRNVRQHLAAADRRADCSRQRKPR